MGPVQFLERSISAVAEAQGLALRRARHVVRLALDQSFPVAQDWSSVRAADMRDRLTWTLSRQSTRPCRQP